MPRGSESLTTVLIPHANVLDEVQQFKKKTNNLSNFYCSKGTSI